jgi:hypothetical protein
VPTVVFIYVSDVKLCLDSVSICFDVTLWVAFINGDMCQWNNCGRDNVSSVSLLFYGEVCIDDV